MNLDFEERLSDSPYVHMIWRTASEHPGSFTSVAASNWEMVVTKYEGQTRLTVRGPETKATPAEYPADVAFFGIIFKLGTFMPHLPAKNLLNRNDLTLPEATSQSVWLHGSSWEIPSFENADTFVDRLAREGLLAHEPLVEAVLQEQPPDVSLRSVQRRFLHVTGLTHNTIQQIERARHALTLLERGVPILDTVFESGYFDQPHLTRSLKRFAGQTPAQILNVSQSK
jgi:AraC-like DNA-binding protein